MNNHYVHNRPELETPEYKAWRNSVFARDGFTCAKCKTPKKQIQAHHIKRFADYPELRYITSNGICLCVDCHRIITGKEEQYEQELIDLVRAKKIQSKKGNSVQFKPKPKWRPKNPRDRYGA